LDGKKKNNEQDSNDDLKETDLKEEAEMKGGYYNNNWCIIFIILAILIFAVMIINFSKTPNKKITNNDIEILKQKIDDANKIAGLSPPVQMETLNPPQNKKYDIPKIIQNKPSRVNLTYLNKENLDDYYKTLI